MRMRVTTIVLAVLAACLVIAPPVEAASSKKPHKAVARLFGDAGMKGHAKFEQHTKKHGKILQNLSVHISRALPLQTFDVVINSQVVGSITTNAAGSGKLHLRTGGPGSSEPMPDNFPKLVTGDSIVVGPLAGTFFVKTKKRFELRGKLEGDNDLSGRVTYREQVKKHGLDRRFEVQVQNAAPGAAFEIFVNGEHAGTVTANDEGRGRFELRTASFIASQSHAQPMPDSFPSLQAGDAVVVGAMTTTLVRKH
jgi:hypothetical protein